MKIISNAYSIRGLQKRPMEDFLLSKFLHLEGSPKNYWLVNMNQEPVSTSK
jgi:hypothetical protein